MKSLAFLTIFYNLNGTLDIRKDYFNYLSKNFKKIYIINTDRLIYFPKFFLGETKKNEKIYHKIPSNIYLINPRNQTEFIEFAGKNNLLIINNFGKSFFNLKIHFLIKKLNLKQIHVDNLGGIGMPAYIELTKPLRFLNYHINY